MTGLVVVSSVLASGGGIAPTDQGNLLVHSAFSQIPVLGTVILTFGLFTFAFSTILGWSYMGEQGAEYLLGVKSNMPYRIIFTIIVFIGAMFPLNLVWDIADTLNGLMVIPNIIAVLLLSGLIASDTKHYLSNLDEVDKTPIPQWKK
jgi:AGCS family alanine or glycine:cation symporter